MSEKKRFRPPGPPRCAGKKLDGTACRSRPHPKAPDGRCANHTQDTELRAMQHAIAAKGGKNTSHLARALKVVAAGAYGDLVERLATGMDDVLAGRLDPARLSAVAQTARAIVVIADQAQTKDRLDRLERRWDEREGFAPDKSEGEVVRIYDVDGDEVPLLEMTEGEMQAIGPPRTDDPPWVRARSAKLRRGMPS